MKNIILILFIINTLFAQYEWSEPIRLSYKRNNVQPEILVSKNVIYVLWSELNGVYPNDISNILCSTSNDLGGTWSQPVNLTPENSTLWFHDVQAVVDSDNNIHICFNCIDTGSFYYMNCINGVWSVPEFLNICITAMPRMVIDNTDRLYLFFMIGGDNQYFIYKEKSGTWTDLKMVPEYYVGLEFVADSSGNLIGSGSSNIPAGEDKAYILRYNKGLDQWSDFIDISLGCQSAISRTDNLYLEQDGTLHAVIDDGVDERYDRTLYKKGNINDLTSWSQAELVNAEGSPWWKQLFIDQNKNPNILENGNKYNILHNTRLKSNWVENVFFIDSTFVINDFDTFFKENIIYMTYDTSESNTDSTYSVIYFTKKEIKTGIEQPIEINDCILYQNYPNPFNNETQIQFSLEKASDIELKIYNVKGEFIQDVVSAKLNKGNHNYIFKADKMNSGIYYYQLITDGTVKETKKMLYMK